MILPAPFPDEMLCSLLARMGRVNGVRDYRELAEAFFGVPICSSFIGANIHLPTFCVESRQAYGAPLDVLDRFTWLVAQARLGEVDIPDIHAIASGEARFALGNVTFQRETVVTYCTACIRSDIDRYGVAYWHRVHQLLFVRCCPDHGSVLKRIKLKRDSLHFSFPLPGDVIDAESLFDEEVSDAHQACRGLSRLAYQALTSELPHDISTASSVLQRELREWGAMDSKGRLRQKQLASRLAKELLDGKVVDQFLAHQIRQDLRSSTSCKVMNRAVLVYVLYGSWSLFEERCRWEAALGSNPTRDSESSTVAITSHEMLRQHFRMACIDFLEANSTYTRHDFIVNEYRSFRWLLHNDKEWLDSQLPILACGATQLVLF